MRRCRYCSLPFPTTMARKQFCTILCQERAKGERQAKKPARKTYVLAWKRRNNGY